VSLRAQLLAQLSRFDDDAWSALANRGLLRRARKDLAVLSLGLVADDADALDIQVGPHVVRFDDRGPVGAACDCPSASVCQHIIVAGLWLLSTPDDAQPAAQSAQPQPQAELLEADVDALTTYAGRAGYRWALRYVDDLDLESDVRVEEDRQIVITLTSPRVTFRFMGGGVAGLVPDIKLPAPEKYQVAAVLVYQRMAGVGPPAEVPEVSKPSGSGQQLVETRTRLRVAAQPADRHCAAWNRAPLAVGARAVRNACRLVAGRGVPQAGFNAAPTCGPRGTAAGPVGQS
jgi:hypothetical protein